MRLPQQQLGCSWTFSCGHSGKLPDALHQVNSFAIWVSISRLARGGLWICRLCSNVRRQKLNRGEGRLGILGRAKYLLRTAKQTARRHGYLAPDITADDLVLLWQKQVGRCAACGRPITLLGCCLDHDHISGVCRGFICRGCNVSEGYLRAYTNDELLRFYSYVQGMAS